MLQKKIIIIINTYPLKFRTDRKKKRKKNRVVNIVTEIHSIHLTINFPTFKYCYHFFLLFDIKLVKIKSN